MKNKRIKRISEEIRRVVSELISHEIKDPRVDPLTSITSVQVTNDLSYAKIHVSVFGDQKIKEETIKGLESAKGFIRKEISNRINLRHVPEPVFLLDESIEHGIYMSELIKKVNKNDRDKKGDLDG